MLTQAAICIDIGSTYTKGILLKFTQDCLQLVGKATVPTTVDHLPKGFNLVLSQLAPQIVDAQSAKTNKIEVFFSSSAKGGLKVAVVGLVPEMSLHIARLAAFSAGAKICASFPYKLTNKHIEQISRHNPDILLLCGGTDGGNERFVCENAKLISQTDFANTIIFAGNNTAAESIQEILSEKKLIITQNLMPDFGKLNTEPVREKIREVFLDQIVSGKGLNEIVQKFATQPVPTPLAVLNLVKAIGESKSVNWDNFALIDMGGATTDFYSYGESFYSDTARFLKGVHEPKLKRTVEGDLGMRVSAIAAYEASKEYFSAKLTDIELEEIENYCKKVQANPDFLPALEKEKKYDLLLAQACVYNSLIRHAGTIEEVFTIKGPVWAQTGKDLSRINKIIATGGLLSAQGRENQALKIPNEPVTNCEKVPLLPQSADYYVDINYLWPLLGNMATKYPNQCALMAVNSLKNMQNSASTKESFQSEPTNDQH